MNLTEHNSVTAFATLADKICAEKKGEWTFASIRRDLLKPVTEEALIMAITPAGQKARELHICFSAKRFVFLAWNGDLKEVYKQLRAVFTTVLAQPGVAGQVMSYFIPGQNAAPFKACLAEEIRLNKEVAPEPQSQGSSSKSDDDPMGWDRDIETQSHSAGATSAMSLTMEQIFHFNELRSQKAARKQLQILAVEDHPFYQKLLFDIIRGVRVGGMDVPAIDLVDGVKAAWDLFVKKAPDIVFVDLGLSDGSGHALSRAIKEVDPGTLVIIVTANKFEEELNVAQQNNVDGFITKPYSKKQIGDYIEKYVRITRARRAS